MSTSLAIFYDKYDEALERLLNMQLTIEQYGIGTPYGKVARTPDEAEAVAKELGMEK